MTTGQGGRRRKRRKKTDRRAVYIRAGILALIALTLILGIYSCVSGGRRNLDVDASEPDIDVQLLDVNAYSRPGIETEGINGIVIHYTANPGSTAQENRDYFNDLQYTHTTEASSNFIIGLEGEIIQCVPTWEVAYASNERNFDTVSIECCHPDESGEFTDETYRSLVQLTAWLCMKFDLTEEDVIRHYDVTGKICPKYFVDHEDEWEEFRLNVRKAMDRSREN
ncbi:MAG TPA: N-acetylmuramoyl-L-alanine amidase [Candidatus Mediterraneibacter excrementigallinarum]|nr:N-acetylmuramoyl-L-alanine amidase [Candidatus Mediterraneibacter excrementigallinarum]